MDDCLDFAALFKQLTDTGERQYQTVLGGIDVRLVHVEAGGPGRWDRHDDTPETVVVWSGRFDVAFRDRTLSLDAGQCCVVPLGVDHRGTSATGAAVILFKAATGR